MNEKAYRKLVEQVLFKIKKIDEWHTGEILKKIGNARWDESLHYLHKAEKIDFNSKYYRRLAYDEVLATLLVMSSIRKRLKSLKKRKRKYKKNLSTVLIKNFNLPLTGDQKKVIMEIDNDLKSEYRMFRILQGDVGSGKTIVSLIAAANVIESNYQVVLMAPTEILAKQHFNLAKKVFKSTNVNISYLTGKTLPKEKKVIQENLLNGKINFLIGTHAVFQKTITYKNLGMAIIDEQHKFGVKQRIQLSKKGGSNCDILLMSATPIPRTLVMAVYGDMDVSKIVEKPLYRKEIITLSKPEQKLNEILLFIKKQINYGNQIFWVCPLIKESKKLDYSAAVKQYKLLSQEFHNKVGLLHGKLNKDEKNEVLNKFLEKKINILVSTTIIEVGIDFPNANVIVIENANKFGLSQLHQLRGRVGRGLKQATCILLYKNNLSENARKRIKILKSSNDGFFIADEDMKLRGFGDILGYKQSGLKDFKIADPVRHEDLFDIAEKNIMTINENKSNFKNYELLMKLFDKADIINDLDKKVINSE